MAESLYELTKNEVTRLLLHNTIPSCFICSGCFVLVLFVVPLSCLSVCVCLVSSPLVFCSSVSSLSSNVDICLACCNLTLFNDWRAGTFMAIRPILGSYIGCHTEKNRSIVYILNTFNVLLVKFTTSS